jgi:hypothetical protein
MVRLLCGAKFKEYFWQIVKPLIFSLVGGVFAYGISYLLSIENMYIESIVIGLVMGSIVLVLNIWFNREFIDTLLELIGRKRK